MTTRKLCNLIAKHEGKLHQAIVGDVREIIKILCDIEAQTRVDRGTVLTLPSETFDALEADVQKKIKQIMKKKK